MSKTKNTGADFEIAVKEIFKMYYTKYPTATLDRKVYLDTKYGKREIDVLITIPFGDYDYKIVVEARDFDSKLSIDKIDGFDSKLRDLDVPMGIMVSKLGFSSKAKAKAKALDIGLFSLQENIAFPDLSTIYFLIQEFTTENFDIAIEIDREKLQALPERFILRDKLLVNGIEIVDAINRGWANGSITFDLTKHSQEIEIPGLVKPYILKYFVDDHKGITNTVELRSLKICVDLKVRHFIADINNVNKHKVLENIHKNVLRFFVSSNTIKDLIENIKPVTPSYAESFKGIKAIIRAKGNAKLRIENVELKPRGSVK